MKVIIIGTGNIGRRHAESLLAADCVSGLTLVDPKHKALTAAAAGLGQLRAPGFPVTLMRTIPKTGVWDLAIIATNSGERYSVAQAVKSRCKYIILEKFLFNRPEEYEIDFRGNAVWVNTYRRALGIYDQFKGTAPSLFYFGMEGLLSNAVHFADLLMYLTGAADVRFQIKLEKRVRSKRRGYWDARGRVIFTTARPDSDWGACGFGQLATYQGKSAIHPFVINNTAVYEDDHRLVGMDGEVRAFEFKYPSEFTREIVRDIHRTGECGLPGFDVSARTHLAFLSALKREGWRWGIT